MPLKTKKIVFSSITLGLSVLSMILFVLPIIEQINSYSLAGYVRFLSFSGASPQSVILGLTLYIFPLFYIILTAAMVALSIVTLLCDVDVIKNEKVRKGFKKALVIVGTFQIVFIFITGVTALALPLSSGDDAEYAGIIITLLLTLALRIMIRFVGRLEKVNEEQTAVQTAAVSTEETAAVDASNTEEPKEEAKTDEE